MIAPGASSRLLRLVTHKVCVAVSRVDLPLSRLKVILDGAEIAQSVGVVGLDDPEQLVGRGALRNHLVGLVDAFLVSDLGVVLVDLLLGTTDPDTILGGLRSDSAGSLRVHRNGVVGHGISDWNGRAGETEGVSTVSHASHGDLGNGWKGCSLGRGDLLNGRRLRDGTN